MKMSEPGDAAEHASDQRADTVLRMPPQVQAKLRIGPVDHPAEREADSVADAVMRMTDRDVASGEAGALPGAPPSDPAAPPLVRRQCATCAEEEEAGDIGASTIPIRPTAIAGGIRHLCADCDDGLQRKESGPAGFHAGPATPAVETALGALGSGVSLPASERAFFEPRFERRFDDVRIHTGIPAHRATDAINARAFTLGNDIAFAHGQYAPGTATGRQLLAHELTHVVQQRATSTQGETVQRQPERPNPQPARRGELDVDVLGADADIDEPIAVMAERGSGPDLRVTSLENMIDQLERLVAGGGCIRQLTIWYHGSPEIQSLVGNYGLGRGRQRMAESGFSRSWLALEGNQSNLNRFRHVFCCNATMRWMGCGTVGVSAAGGHRLQEEGSQAQSDQSFFERRPDVYGSEETARAHGASLLGATFGGINAQTWANATCTTIFAATNFVHLRPNDPRPITVERGGRFVSFPPQREDDCPCDPATGRVAGAAPTRDVIVGDFQRLTREAISPDRLEWHQNLQVLREYVPSVTPIVGSALFLRPTRTEPRGTIPDLIRAEVEGTRRPLESRPRPNPVAQSLEREAADVIISLLAIAGRGITPPAPLPAIPFSREPGESERRSWVRIEPTDGGQRGITLPHLVVCFPDPNLFWRWIVFTDRAILQTPEFTRSIMMHELRHAADQWTLFQAFQRDHGPPPPRPADPAQCRPFTTGRVVIGTDPWDQYVGEFIRYHDNRVAPGRHLEITAMEQQEDFARWSAREQADWVESMFANLPGDIPPDVSLPGEQAVLSTFAGASTALRRVIVHAAANVFRTALHPPVQWDVPENAAEQRENRARARTLLGHFAPIVDAAIAAHYPILGRRGLERDLR